MEVLKSRDDKRFYGGNQLLTRTRLVYSTTRLDQETTRHFAVITDANTLHNRAAEWKKEEILSSCVWKASDILRLCSAMLSQPVLSSLWVKTCHPHTDTSNLIEILITTSNHFAPSEKKRETNSSRGERKKKPPRRTFSSKDGWRFCSVYAERF